MGKNLFIADLHFGHENMIKMDNRPFESLEEMEAKLIENWNKKVDNGDHVYVLGDMFWRRDEQIERVMRQLKGTVHLLIGNHDRWIDGRTKKYFAEVTDWKVLKDNDWKVFLSHYPNVLFPGHRHPNNVMLYGHVHLSHEFDFTMNAQKRAIEDPNIKSKGLLFNVGAAVEYMEYAPQTLEVIMEKGSEFFNKFHNSDII